MESFKSVFAATERTLNRIGFEMASPVALNKKFKGTGFERSMQSADITGTRFHVVVIREKIAGMVASFDVMIVDRTTDKGVRTHPSALQFREIIESFLNKTVDSETV